MVANGYVRFAYKIVFFYQQITFLSHNKSATKTTVVVTKSTVVVVDKLRSYPLSYPVQKKTGPPLSSFIERETKSIPMPRSQKFELSSLQLLIKPSPPVSSSPVPWHRKGQGRKLVTKTLSQQ